jgi:hexosaminidase
MTWPRAFAIAEALWSPKEKRNWNDFVPRVENHFERLEASQVKYAPSMYDAIVEVSKKDTATIIVKLSTEIEGLSVHYSFDNSFPDNFYPKYSTPLIMPKDAAAMKAITCRDNKPIGRISDSSRLEEKSGLK